MNNSPDTGLPFFAYGLLMPGEIAHKQIQRWVAEAPTRAVARGSLWVRDGLPLLDPGGHGRVAGYLMRFDPEHAASAYSAISTFEPGEQYKWRRVILDEPREAANTLVGLAPRRASILSDEQEVTSWSSRRDPLFAFAVPLIASLSAEDASQGPFKSAPSDSFAWERFFRLQMAYLLLWAVIERYASLCYGPTLIPVKKVESLGRDPAFAEALRRTVTGCRRVFDSRNPDQSRRLDPTDPVSSAHYYYLIRCNVSHRGKAAFKDGELIRTSLHELITVMEQVLAVDSRAPESVNNGAPGVGLKNQL